MKINKIHIKQYNENQYFIIKFFFPSFEIYNLYLRGTMSICDRSLITYIYYIYICNYTLTTYNLNLNKTTNIDGQI